MTGGPPIGCRAVCCPHLAVLGLCATCNPGGAGKWLPAYTEALTGARVILLPDKDTPGRRHAALVLRALTGKAASVAVVELPDRDGKPVKDAADWVAAGGTVAELREIVRRAPTWQPPPEEPAATPLTVEPAGKPAVILPHGRQSISEAGRALGELLAKTNRFFIRGGAVVKLATDPDGLPHLEDVRPAALASDFEAVAFLCKPDGPANLAAATCPEQTAKLIAASATFRAALPPIHVLTRCPVLIERDGRLIQIAGYDRESGIWAAGDPAEPLDLAESRRLLWGMLDGFRFATPADRARALAAFVEEAARKGRAEHLTERLIESKTGRPVEYARIEDLADRWRALGRETPPSPRYLAACDAHFGRFVAFMRNRNPDAVHLYEVTPEDTAAFVAALQTVLARKTVRDAVKLLNKSFDCALPVGTANPFAAFMGRRMNGDGETVHRKPFTPEELRALLDAARDDDFMHPLITAAACTGMRRGDVCGLPWSAVDLAGGMLAVKTSKTGATVEIPIFAPLRAVLEARKGTRGKLVFPEAAAMLRDNPDGLTWRFKKIVARAFAGDAPPHPGPELVPAAAIMAEGENAIREHVPEGSRRDRMLDTFRRYCAGASVREIVTATGRCKGTVSGDLHAAQDLIGKPFLRVQNPSVKTAVRLATQAERDHGQRAASVRDWHALRATFVTLALGAGVPVELVRRVTGHATVEIVLKHYFRPDREHFRAALTAAMPEIITGGCDARLKPADELASLAEKVKAGTATNEDKARLRKLAERV